MTGCRMVRANGVRLGVETFGSGPAVLLVAGAGASMLAWDERFCARIAAGGRQVIRYDHRDTGRSSGWPAGDPDYTLHDLTDDAMALLDVLNLETAHLVGISMGGMIAQLAALGHPGRVRSLTVLSSTTGEEGLPGMSPSVSAELHGLDWPDWTDRESTLDYLVALERPMASPSRPFDESARREVAGRVFDRTSDLLATTTNPMLMPEVDPWYPRLGEITAPTLVIHGVEDQVFPFPHAVALTQRIRHAELIALPEAGHALSATDWDVVVPAILRQTG